LAVFLGEAEGDASAVDVVFFVVDFLAVAEVA
jgi:hypothetical protein